ncbi:cytochrome c biogenesis protein ResB [Tersicoccus sp. Bi-70]|uniref:cytochrome c biogenesis protein ResB n=1 Tax=Tersicoccus sp. Bi-70 TaxID=1897634 RepID=UPI00097635F9|nr:cytochrome c biogenesis protein ResB [Tersicoccus sp. Bi-70]OMH34573.1 cytochrome C biogenesis protein ResB [Tersicoccus sp. Bi-70]
MPRLGFLGSLRWAWRQLTSMRVALMLLLLLAVAAVPGSIFPQRPSNPATVTAYLQNNPVTGPWLDRFQFFDVYASVWFSAIYLLLFVSLIGCVVPRSIAHLKALRQPPPRTPRRLSRMPQYGTLVVPAEAGTGAADVARRAAAVLKRRGYRVRLQDLDGDRPSAAAERGYLRETGNLIFHTALIGVLVSVAVGGLFGYRGQRTLVEGDSFVNTLVGYDSFNPGTNFADDHLDPFSLQLDKFDVTFDRESTSHYGQPIDFNAHLTTRETPSSSPVKHDLKVNSPVELGGSSVYLVGNGYAPVVTVRDGEGKVAWSGPVVSTPTDAMYTSAFVLKVPDAKPQQLSFVGFFLPTAVAGADKVAFSGDPDPLLPQLNLNSFKGDLGLNNGVPTSVFALDTSKLTPVNARNLPAGGIVLDGSRATQKLPGGLGSITFEGVKRYIAIDVRHDPGQIGALVFSTAALLGLIGSLFVPRRRAWVRAGRAEDGRVMVEYGLLARGEDHRLERARQALGQALDDDLVADRARSGKNDAGGNTGDDRRTTGL